MQLKATSLVAAVAFALTAVGTATAGTPQPKRIAAIAKAVFGSRAPSAECIAHFESTDGAYLYNGTSLGPWQVDVVAHPWVNAHRLITDWWYSARVAYRLSNGGRDWHIWGTHRLCNV